MIKAKQVLDGLGYTDDSVLERMPRAALDLIVRTAAVKNRAADARPKTAGNHNSNPGAQVDRDALADYNRRYPHAPINIHPSWLG